MRLSKAEARILEQYWKLGDLFGGSAQLLVSDLLETGTLTLKDLKANQDALPSEVRRRRRGKAVHDV